MTERTALPIEVKPHGLYREIGIRSHGKGIFHKEPVEGATLGAKRVFQVVPNRLVFNIVFAWEGAVAATSSQEQGMIASHRFPMFGPSREGLIEVEFLRRFFQTELGVKLLGDASPGGAGRNRTLNQKFTAEIPVPVPPLPEQRKIAAILSSVDDAIEATQAVIDQLQVVKKAMMAELLTRGLPGRHTRFKQTEIGEIPEKWVVTKLGELIDKGPDNGVYKPQSEYGDGVPIVRIDAFDNGGMLDRNCNLRRVRLSNADTLRYSLQRDDILINRVNSLSHIAKTAIVGFFDELVVFESNMMRLAVNREYILPAFAFCVISSDGSRDFFRARAKQAVAQASVNQGDVRELPVRLPPIGEQMMIAGALAAVDERIASEIDTLQRCELLKSALTSVLLTGELRVTPDEASP